MQWTLVNVLYSGTCRYCSSAFVWLHFTPKNVLKLCLWIIFSSAPAPFSWFFDHLTQVIIHVTQHLGNILVHLIFLIFHGSHIPDCNLTRIITCQWVSVINFTNNKKKISKNTQPAAVTKLHALYCTGTVCKHLKWSEGKDTVHTFWQYVLFYCFRVLGEMVVWPIVAKGLTHP